MPHRNKAQLDPLVIHMVDHAPIMMGLVEVEGDDVVHVYHNHATAHFMGSKREDTYGKKVVEGNASQEQSAYWADRFREAKVSGAPVQYSHELPARNTWIQVTVQFIKTLENGRDLCSYLFEDITEKRSLFGRLKAERDRFRLAVEGASAGLWDWDVASNNVVYSRQWKEMLGYSETDFPNVYESWKSLLHPEDTEIALRTVEEYLSRKTPEYRLEHRLRCKDGSFRWILAKGVASWNSAGEPLRFTGWHIDIHELKSTVEELRRRDKIIQEQQVKIIASAKMSSLGEMAGGIAHEINNPLAIIALSATQISDALKARPANSALVEDGLQRIAATVQRIGKIVKGLRAFSRSGENDPFLISPVEPIVNDTLELCRERFHSNSIDLRISPVPRAQLECRAVQISQVLLNLLSNALDAVKGQPDGWVKLEATETEEGVEFSVADNGRGILPDVAKRMMEPFFTTKDVGEGTGLGLSIAKGIVEDHGGTLRFETENGSTRFFFQIPRRVSRN